MVPNPLPRLPYAEAARNLLRDSILLAVDELVRVDGWAATSVATVARAAGVSRQTVYKEFGSRQSIAEAYVMRTLNDVLDAATVEITESDDLESGMRRAIDGFFDLADAPMVQIVIAGGAGSNELNELIRTINERATERLASLFQHVRPHLNHADAIIFGDSVARVCAGHAFAQTIPREQAVDRIVRLIMVLLGPA